MAFLKNFIGGIISAVTSTDSPYSVQEVNSALLAKCEVVCRDDGYMNVYKDGQTFFLVLYHPDVCKTAYSLFRVSSEGEAVASFTNYSTKLTPVCSSSKRIYNKELLQQACEAIRNHHTWTSAHLAAYLGLTECFRHNIITSQLNEVCTEDGRAPIHIAVEVGNVECVQELLIHKVRLDIKDVIGDTVFHYAARVSEPKIIQLLAAAASVDDIINQVNAQGESPLHVACLSDKPECVDALLRCSADPCIATSTRYPSHCAMKVGSVRCLERLHRWHPEQVHMIDGTHGGTALHWARNKESVDLCMEFGCEVDAVSRSGDTPLSIMIQKDRLECVMTLLSRNASTLKAGKDGNTPLHLAIATDQIDLVRIMVVFGADVNALNSEAKSPRHCAATSKGTNRDIHLYTLHMVGARRCRVGVQGCNEGCIMDGSFNGTPQGSPYYSLDPSKKFYDDMIAAAAVSAAMADMAGFVGGQDGVDSAVNHGYKLLCLDGGGIRGLVLIQLLLAIEKVVGRPIKECFDWIGGTSTGGILALAIVHGKSVRYAQGLYFRLKNEVFTGKRPYDSEPLEWFLKKEFGETTRMTEVEHPKVIVTGVLADRHPAQIHFFRNFNSPQDEFQRSPVIEKPPENPNFHKPTNPNDQYVWRAARCSGAAPTYFRACGRFLDGGLIANNPTLDIMTEVHEYNLALKALGRGHQVRPIGLVVSLGTGKPPVVEMKSVDVYRPSGIMDTVRSAIGVHTLGTLLVDQATQAEGRPVDRAQAWCSMINVPFYRFSPQLSEDIPLDCKDDATLARMLWETQAYIHGNMDKIQQLAVLLSN